MNDPKPIDIFLQEISYKTSSGEIISYHKDITKSVEKFIKMQQQMEKQQIKNAVISTFKAVDGYCFGMTAEEYYEEYIKSE